MAVAGPAPPAAVNRPESSPDRGGVSAPIWFSPHGLADNRWERWAFGGFATVLLGVFLVGLIVPRSVETLPAALLIVVAAGWLFSTRLALLITITALTLPLVELLVREADPTSAAVQVAVFGLLAVATRAYSNRLRSLLRGGRDAARSMAAGAFGLENLAHVMDASTQGLLAIDHDGLIRYANEAASDLLGLESAPGDFYARVTHDDRDRVRAAFQTGDTAGYLNFAIERADGSVRAVQATHTRVVVRGKWMVASTIRDVSQINRLQSAATALAETAAGLAVTQPLDETLAAIAHRVIEVTHACACAVFLREGERSVRVAGSWGLPPGYGETANFAISSGANPPVFQAMQTGTPVFVEDLPDLIQTRPFMAPLRRMVMDVPWKHAIAFPMTHSGRAVGGLCVYLMPGHRLDEPTIDFLATIAGQAASAAEISRLVSAGQDQAAANERTHLSRELHDSLSQRLYGIILGARAIESRLKTPAPEVRESVDYIMDLAQGGLNEMRDIVLQLRPDFLEREGLIAAVSKHLDVITSRSRIEATKDLPPEPSIPLVAKIAAYRIAVEALNNVAKHANAEHAWLRIDLRDGRLEIEVRDDGTGFDAGESPPPGHFGLDTMRERARSEGGVLTVQSSGDGGTTVRASLPVGERIPIHSGGGD